MNKNCLSEPFLDKEFTTSGSSRPHWHLWLLVGSLCINAAAMTYFFAEWNDGVLWFEVETRPRPEISAETIRPSSDTLQIELSRLSNLSDQDLLASLKDQKVVANGYQVRELVLSILEVRGYQIQGPLRSTGFWPISKSLFSWKDSSGNQHNLLLYSSLKDAHFDAMERFCTITEVPFTSEGIVARLNEDPTNAKFKEALLRTEDWSVLHKLFLDRSEDELFLLCSTLGATIFSRLTEYGRAGGNSEGLASTMLKLFHENPSRALADLIATNYANHVVVQATDEDLLLLLKQLPHSSPSGVRLAMRLLRAQRKTPIWDASQAYLALEKELQPVANMKRDQALAFLQKLAQPSNQQEQVVKSTPKPIPAEPKKVEKKAAERPSASTIVSNRLASRQLRPYRKYVVKKGDTLWAVAKRFNVDVEKLKYLNGLRGTELSVGKELRIPH